MALGADVLTPIHQGRAEAAARLMPLERAVMAGDVGDDLRVEQLPQGLIGFLDLRLKPDDCLLDEALLPQL